MTDWSAIRGRFPAVESSTYLNTAAGAPISVEAAEAGAAYYRASRDDGDVHWEEWLSRVGDIRARMAAWLGAGAEDLAFVGNASAGLNLAARMLAGRSGVLLVEDDFPSVTWPWMQQGFDVRFAEPAEHGGASLEALEAARTPETGVLAVGLVHYRTGYRYDLAAVSRWCREREIALVVDATQALGALRVRVDEAPVDFLVSSAYKWLTAGYGVACLYVHPRWRRPELYSAVGWRSAREPYALDANRLDVASAAEVLEAGHPPFPAVFSLGAALWIHERIGARALERRVLSLADRARAGLLELGLEPFTSEDPDCRSGIVTAPVEGAERLVADLADSGIRVSARGGALRVSTHLYNDERDVDRLLDALSTRTPGR